MPHTTVKKVLQQPVGDGKKHYDLRIYSVSDYQMISYV